MKPGKKTPASPVSGVFAGFSVTPGDYKAAVFYFALFPAVVNLDGFGPFDTVMVAVTAIAAIVVPKIGYAALATRLGAMARGTRTLRGINGVAGAMLAATGAFLLLKVLLESWSQ